jgi:hypothetical protein
MKVSQCIFVVFVAPFVLLVVVDVINEPGLPKFAL